jgi:uncharacterized protein YbjT (DUF2867 family)
MILVVGATGFLGGEICRLLREQDRPVRALVRATSDPARVERLSSLGAEVVPGDMRDYASLETACQGATAVILTASAIPFSYDPQANNLQTVDRDGAISLIDAAQAAQVGHFTYVSYSAQRGCPSHDAKRAVEQRLRQSGLNYTILQPSYFMEGWLSPGVGFDAANARARIYGDGSSPISFISLFDVAKFAVASLDNPAARNATILLGGPEALSPLQAVKIFEAATGRPFQLEYMPVPALEAAQAGATDGFEQSFMALAWYLAQGDRIDMSATLQAFPVRLRTVSEYAAWAVSGG